MRRALAIAAAAGAFAAGCGTGEDERAAARAVERFYAAIEQQDGAAACEQLSQAAASELESSRKRPCEEAVLGLELTPSGVSSAEVEITSARVDLEAGGSAFLDETSRGWRISALGCQPRPSLPYDCELEA